MLIRTIMAAALLTCTLGVRALAATPSDPCAEAFAEIATGLEQARADAVLKHLTRNARTVDAVQSAVADRAMALKLAEAFKTAQLKSTFDNKRIYQAADFEIGATVGVFGCVVQAW
jgi:hypothetical protein